MASTPATGSRSPLQGPGSLKTIIIGISGPSSSGKTTLARLLRTIFSPPTSPAAPSECDVNTFIIHEDDFYKPDDQIPVTTTLSGKLVQDWDTIDALNVPQLVSTLSYVRRHGKLPANLKSKEDLNHATDSGVDDATIERLQGGVAERLRRVLTRHQRHQERAEGSAGATNDGDDSGGKTEAGRSPFSLSLAFLDGFLLYAPPGEDRHPLSRVQKYIDIPLFLPAPYTLLKERREGRTGYVTIGPAPTPVPKDDDNEKKRDDDASAEELNVAESNDDEDGGGYDPPQQNFWTDPPGYVDDIVWPRYIEDHAWLLLTESQRQAAKDIHALKEMVGEGENVRVDMGVIVAPGKGKAPMIELLGWAVEEVVVRIEQELRKGLI
ncbi:hypothetical protein VTO42DRAFT_1978 [Malbranchea cinnamomea]